MPTKTGLVLSGGGARGAYEVGVLKYIYEKFGTRARFDVLSGSSVGAINAGFVASISDDPGSQIRNLQKIWENLVVWKELHYGFRQLVRLPLLLFGRIPVVGKGMTRMALGHSIFDVRHLVGVVQHQIPWDKLKTNLAQGFFESLAISATEILSGVTTIFAMTSQGILPAWSRDPKHRGEITEVSSVHALASSAIPLLFPMVAIDGRVFCDGGMRQNTPIGPTLRLGATRLFIIRLKAGKGHTPLLSPFATPQPSPSFLIGKLFNALFLDQLDYDLERLDRINRILEDGEMTFGKDFGKRLSETTMKHRGQSWKKVDTLVIGPSQDLGAIAAEVIRDRKFRGEMPFIWKIIMRFLDSGRPEEADLLSYLLFDGHYCSRLIELGYKDAADIHGDLEKFFTREPGGEEEEEVDEGLVDGITAGGV